MRAEDEELLDRCRLGNRKAWNELLDRHRERLRQMVALRMDRRLQRRLDPSDIIQEALVEANRLMPDYLEKQPIAFYPWLRQLAFNRLLDVHRRHILAQRRSMAREEDVDLHLPPDSALQLAGCLCADQSGPSSVAQKEERAQQVQQALLQLNEVDREVLVLLYLEKMPIVEVAGCLEITEAAVKMRHLRALKRLRPLLQGPVQGG